MAHSLVARLKTPPALGEMEHKGSLNTPQFDDFNCSAARAHGVPKDNMFPNVHTPRGLHCEVTPKATGYFSGICCRVGTSRFSANIYQPFGNSKAVANKMHSMSPDFRRLLQVRKNPGH